MQLDGLWLVVELARGGSVNQTYNLSRMHGYYPCKIFIFWVNFAVNIQCFAKKSAFVAFYGILVTHLVAHRFTLDNPRLAIPIIYLLRVI